MNAPEAPRCGWCGGGRDVRDVDDPEGYEARACASCRWQHGLPVALPVQLPELDRAGFIALLRTLGDAKRHIDAALAELGVDLGVLDAAGIDQRTPEALARLAEELLEAGDRMVAAVCAERGR